MIVNSIVYIYIYICNMYMPKPHERLLCGRLRLAVKNGDALPPGGLYVYIYIYIYIYIYTHMYTYMYRYIYIYTHTHMYRERDVYVV